MDTVWPNVGPDFNNWQTDLLKFVTIVDEAKDQGFWCADMDLKYLTIRIDTRNCRWLLYIDGEGQNKIRVDPQRVIDAINKWNIK